jgi:DNA-binding response OmpR family regulator
MAKVLIIEDDQVLNQAYKFILEREGHDVAVAFNGQEGLEKAKLHKPTIILLDLLMPIKSGLEFLKEYDIPGKHPKVKVVILSNIGDEKEAEKGLKLGAYKYIVKAHASPQELSVLVNHLISKNLSKKAK